jgi:aminopeptidase N
MIYRFIILLLMTLLSTNLLAQRSFKIYESASGKEINLEELVELTIPSDVIFFGEFHDDSLIHVLESQYLEKFFKEKDETAVSMEMFERDDQEVLAKYVEGDIDEKEFLEKSTSKWRTYDTDYKPLVELAKKNDSYVIAANVPRKYAAMFSKGGFTSFQSLTPDERKMIARNIDIADDEYKTEFYKTMIGMFGKEKEEDLTPNEENTIYLFYGAQVVKDETMAESIVDYINENSGTKVIHYCGNFHSGKGLGTVQKVKDKNSVLKISVIAPAYVDKGEEITWNEDYKNEGDYIIALEAKPPDMFAGMMGGGHMGGNYIISHEIEIELDPVSHNIKGMDKFKFLAPVIKTASVQLLPDLKIESVKSEDAEIEWIVKEQDGMNEITIKPVKDEVNSIIINYSGNVYHQAGETTIKQRHAYSKGMISSAEGEGIYLPAGSFYPYTDDDMADFSLKVTYPEGIDVLTSGVVKNIQNNSGLITKHYETELPADNLTLVGGKYISVDSVYDGKNFSVLTFHENRYAGTFLNSMIEYYKDYTKLFGAYPYSNFSLVENFFATGFGMPGYTLISGKLLQMPWVLLSPGSLAHEFVHNWWGNSVYIKQKSGNWCEALTTFSANYYYNVITKQEDKALDWRKKALTAIEDLPEESNYPLEDFEYQKNSDDAVIGYSKGAFLFYEIYKLFGDEHFFNAMKEFAEKYKGKRASWFSIIYTMNGYAKKNNLDIPVMQVFNQWLKKKEVPSIYIDNASFEDDSLRFKINQDGQFYTVVPVMITTENDIIWNNCTLTGGSTEFSVAVNNDVKKVEVDPEYQVLRRLNKWEIPYTFNNSLNDNPLIILPSGKSDQLTVAKEFINYLTEAGYKADAKSFDDVTLNDWENRSIIVLGDGTSNPFMSEFNGKYPGGVNFTREKIVVDNSDYPLEGNILLMNIGHPKDETKYATIIGYNKMDTPDEFRRLFHYMSYSLVMISKTQRGKPVVSKELFPSEPQESPMKWENL